MIRRLAGAAPWAAVPTFFAIKVGTALILLAASTAWLPVAGFAAFTQLMILAALMNLVAIGGSQNGIIRLTAAAEGEDQFNRMRGAALAIWLCVLGFGGLLAILFREALSILLVGDIRVATGAMLVVLLTLASGPGQVFTSVLTGRGRSTASLIAQGCGLLAGTLAALAMLARENAEAAAVAFAAGPILTMGIAWLLVRMDKLAKPSFARLGQSLRVLWSYSGATALVAGSSAIVLFSLRFVYQEAFGLDSLGQWIAANRISDTTTQLLGLTIIQLFVPRYATTSDRSEARRLVLMTWAAGVAIMGLFLATFALAPEFLVRLFLSPDYLPAITGILLYMTGDVLRVWAAVAMNALLARGKPWAYASVEVGTMGMMAALAAAWIAGGEPLAPMLAYVCAYGLTALIVSVAFVRSLLTSPDSDGRAPGEAGRRTGH